RATCRQEHAIWDAVQALRNPCQFYLPTVSSMCRFVGQPFPTRRKLRDRSPLVHAELLEHVHKIPIGAHDRAGIDGKLFEHQNSSGPRSSKKPRGHGLSKSPSALTGMALATTCPSSLAR